MQDIWFDIMHTYHNKKIPVIPLNRERKPYHKDWSKWNDELPEEPLYKKGQAGFGILPGKESGVMIVDIDTDDPELMKKLKEIIPTTPVQRIGSKGVGLIFAYNSDIVSRKFKNIKVEIFASSGYVVLPPSFHEKTGKEYYWVGKSLLDFDRDLLPSFDLEVIQKLDSLNDSLSQVRNPGEKAGVGGRHDMLLSQLFAGLNNKSLEELIDEITWYDLNMHNPPWSYDELGATNPKEARALLMKWGIGVKKTKDRRIAMENKIAEETLKKSKVKKFQSKKYPIPQGFMKDVIQYMEPLFMEESYESCMTGALALMSVLCANRFSCQGVRSNMYIINLAETGSGKSFAMSKIIDEILFPVAPDLVGRGSYQSESALWHVLTTRKSFVDTLDEVSSLIKKTNDSTSLFSEILLKLWDSSGGNWRPPAYSLLNKVASEMPKYIANPCLSIWGASTIKTFESVINAGNYDTGLLPRMLILIKEGHGKIQNFVASPKDVEKVVGMFRQSIAQFISNFPLVKNLDPGAVEISHGEVPITAREISTEAMNEYMRSLGINMHARMQDTKDESLKGFLTRYPQHLRKLAMVHAISRSFNEININPTLIIHDVDWANEFLETMIHNNTIFFNRTATYSDFEKKKAAIASAIIKSGDDGVARSFLINSYKGIQAKTLDLIINDLQEGQQIVIKEVSNESGKGGRPKKTYFAVNPIT